MDSCISISFILIRTYAITILLLFCHTVLNRFHVGEVSCYALFADSVFLFPAHASDIDLHGTTTVAYGGDANFNCMLANPTGKSHIWSVSWQLAINKQPWLFQRLPVTYWPFVFPAGVLQVTWQRGLRPESLENMATYNKPVGEQINEPFKGKVILNNSSLSSSSITLKNVTWADENCYVCSFNVYPDGSKRKQICLKVEGELVFLFLRWSLFQNVGKH